MDAQIVESDVSPDEIVTVILAMSEALPAEEEACVLRMQEIGLLARRLLTEANVVSADTVLGWAKRLHRVPALIGIHPDFSNEAQRIIDGIRNTVEAYIDIELPEIARDKTVAEEHPDGIDIFLGEEGGGDGITLED